MARFADRLAPNIDQPPEAACTVRPPSLTIAGGVGAGLGAAVGSIGGGSALAAGIGGGAGVIVAYVVVWLTLLGKGMSLTMALVLTAEQLELYRLGLLSASKPKRLIRAIPYAKISGVHERTRWVDLLFTVLADGDPLELATARRGDGEETVEHLQRRIAG
jgi:hypothetical protein